MPSGLPQSHQEIAGQFQCVSAGGNSGLGRRCGRSAQGGFLLRSLRPGGSLLFARSPSYVLSYVLLLVQMAGGGPVIRTQRPFFRASFFGEKIGLNFENLTQKKRNLT